MPPPSKLQQNTMNRSDESLVALRRILRSTEMHGRELAKAAGVTPAQLRVLQILTEHGTSTPTSIATRMGVSQPTMTSIIDRLVSKSLVQRHQSNVDRRQTDLMITKAGIMALEQAPDRLQSCYVSQFETLESWEQAMIIASLERVAAMLDTAKTIASPVLDDSTLGRS